MKEFKNKVAAITGSATGIGRAFAEEAAKRGMRLALIDINTEGLEETKAICEKAGAPKVVTIKTDVTKYEEVRFSILRVMQEYGQLDLMFANAGIATAGWVYNHPPQDWAWAMNTNVLGLTYYVHEVLPIFKQQGTPCHFLFTASIAGLITGLRYNTAYLASKHAAVCIAEAVRDLAENDPDYSMMGVSVFCPEYVHTNIHNSEDHRPADYSVPCDPFYATDSYWDYRRLFDSNITVVACQNRSNISLICGGGFYHRNTELFDSPEGVALISRLNINKCFMAAAGVTSKGNLSCIEPYEFMYKKAAINSSSTRILLVDSSKFGKMRPCMFSNLSDFDIVITDGDIGGNWIRLFEQSNLKYIIV